MAEHISADEMLFKRYLLVELSEAEEMRLEERLLEDKEYFEEFQLVEDDLIDDYVSGALSPREVEKFENYFMATPERQRQVSVAKLLNRDTGAPNSSQESAQPTDARRAPASWWRSTAPMFMQFRNSVTGIAFAAVVLLLLAFGVAVWLSLRAARPESVDNQPRDEEQANRQESARTPDTPSPEPSARLGEETNQPFGGNQPDRPEQEESNSDSSQSSSPHEPPSRRERQRQQSQPGRGTPSVITLALVPERLRSAGGASGDLKLPSGTQQLRLELGLVGGNEERYRAEIRTAEGEQIMRQENLKARQAKNGKFVVVTLSAGLVTVGDYIVTLSGAPVDGEYEQVGTYYFRIVSR
jgi:hypothetical protein